jgi:hypothetical protein
MRTILFILFAVFSSYVAKAQWPFVKGFYYTSGDQKISGLINFSPSKRYISIKADKDSKAKKIDIKDIDSIVMMYGGLTGNDTLIVLNEDNNANKRYFAKFLFASPVTRFYNQFFEYSGGGEMTPTRIGLSDRVRMTYSSTYYGRGEILMYQDGNTTHEVTKKNYIEVLSKAFADFPELTQRIQNKNYKYKELGKIFYHYKIKSVE